MKKILFTATMLVGFAALSKAQTTGRVGINTSTPAATLDVTANTTDASRPDALLVPRMTRAQLEAKNAAYDVAQNGALAFVSSIADGAGAGKTVNVTATGFYYYDAPNSVWKGIGGGGAVAPVAPTFRTIPGAATTNILASDVGNIVVITGSVSGNIILPTPTADMVGKKLTLISTGSGSQSLTDANSNYLTNTLSSLQQFATELITDGTNWYGLGGQ